ncbi:TfoX/Sxy family protein [Nakamurella leprariae]|uniref:TfoX/Sxy family protein n=1 Tax=Nakamurella leprariae TaxID=2803911 RepID=A0A938YGC0_9ACTN|nr:TfoX/Sxy family protein [Nakamurella leprariae]MBM9469078.1 TfoX/Sxy family protein [Nakamurella leprariae]
MPTDTDPTRVAALALFDELGEPFEGPDTSRGRMFGAHGLRINDKFFAMIDSHGRLMVKLPHERIDDLVREGHAQRLVMNGRSMREWAVLPYADDEICRERWSSAMSRAHDFLLTLTSRPRKPVR